MKKKFEILTAERSQWRRYLIQHPEVTTPNEMGDLVFTNVPNTDSHNLKKIVINCLDQPGAMLPMVFMCDPAAQAVLMYLFDHRQAIIRACRRSDSKTLQAFAMKADAWHNKVEAQHQNIVSQFK